MDAVIIDTAEIAVVGDAGVGAICLCSRDCKVIPVSKGRHKGNHDPWTRTHTHKVHMHKTSVLFKAKENVVE